MIGTILRPLGLVALALAACLPASAKEMTLGGAVFDVPDGWEKQDDAEGILLVRSFPETEDTEQAAAMIQLLNIKGAPASLDANIAEMVSWVDGMYEEDPMVDSAGTTLHGHSIKVEYRCCSYSSDVPMGQTIAGVAAENEQLLAGLIFVNTSSDHQDEADEAFEALVRSVRFKGDSAEGMKPQAGDGGLDGVFTHLDTGLMPNAFGGLDFNSESEIMVFDPDGLFSSAIPAGGDMETHCAANPTDCGTYKVSGGGWFGGARQIEMRSMVDGYGVIETETLPLEKSGNDLKIDGGDYFRLPPFDNGTTFDGTWTYTWASSGMTATSSGGVAVERTLVFKPDGTFTRRGWSGGSSSGDMGGVTVSSKRAGSSGTYEVSGYQLVLTARNGTSETLSIFAPDRDDTDLLVIDGANYLKQD
ncbi:hypothetical protein VW35_04465 [Devosia soli]|uniref:Uncharacterized protein n=1 Tax=Devosia soli TaxID=361041 RepID=A0A0F5LDT7_9HYPH|nr:hypothetical protein [Devosia soli]KKB79767.1 hypothetical protein VW35_04465 [Devosia soli]